MKKRLIAGAALASLGLSFLAADTQDIKTTAWFDLKTHTTLGYNFEEKVFGMESSIDQAQVWWEFLPYATRGVEEGEGEALSASVRIEGLKYAFKFYNDRKAYYNDDHDTSHGYQESPSENNSSSNYFDYERIVSEIKWKNWFANFYYYDYEDGPAIGFNHASIKSLFDDFRNDHIFDSDKDNRIGLLKYNGIKDTRDIIGRGTFGLTGILSTGLRFENWNVMLSGGTPGSWISTNTEGSDQLKSGKPYQKLNEKNKGVFQIDAEATPTEDLLFKASGIATMNYSKEAADTAAAAGVSAYDIYSGGASAEYFMEVSKGVLAPYAGVDVQHARNDDDKNTDLEVGAGLAWYWRGRDFKYNNETLDEWGREFPVGVSLGANTNQDAQANLVFSVYEKADKDALIPNLGGFFEFEWVNIARKEHQDSAFFLAGQLEYLIKVPTSKRKTMDVKPYLFGRVIQERDSDGFLTRKYPLDTRIGVVVYPCARFNIDLRYERADVIWDLDGQDNELDKGCLTCRFNVRL